MEKTEKMELITLYKCPFCKKEHSDIEKANECLNIGIMNDIDISVGDIVECKYGFGWFDGSIDWVINPNVKLKHGFDKNCSMGFYYVVTKIDLDGHRKRYHLYTLAMTAGHSNGYTFTRTHYSPKKILNPPLIVLEESKTLIGKESKYLL